MLWKHHLVIVKSTEETKLADGRIKASNKRASKSLSQTQQVVCVRNGNAERPGPCSAAGVGNGAWRLIQYACKLVRLLSEYGRMVKSPQPATGSLPDLSNPVH